MRNGIYRTAAGSTVTIRGLHGGIIEIDLDWVEEAGACIDCEPNVIDGCLVWGCEHGHVGSAELVRCDKKFMMEE